MGKRVLICGGRNYGNARHVSSVLTEMHEFHGIDVVIHGGATGADALGAAWAKENHGVRIIEFKADWKKHGRAAGPIRNRQMLQDGLPDIVLAFDGGRGTANMIKQARAFGVRVFEDRCND